MNDYTITARRCLETLRDGTHLYDSALNLLFRALQLKKLTLEDIDTDDKEIGKLRLLGCKIAAVRWRDILRENSFHTNVAVNFISYMYQELESGELSLEDIGIEDDEMQSFKQERCVATC